MKAPWFVAVLLGTCHFVVRKRDTGAAPDFKCRDGQKTRE